MVTIRVSGEQEEEVESLPSLSPEFNQLVITHQSSPQDIIKLDQYHLIEL
jgi:hypothetical protein